MIARPFPSSPRPACGERVASTKCEPGEGDSPFALARGYAPSPEALKRVDLSPQAGRGERGVR
jgi:hypothetical protein